MSDQHGICGGQPQKCLENARCPTVISYSDITLLHTYVCTYVHNYV